MAGSIALKQYLEDKNILPNSVWNNWIEKRSEYNYSHGKYCDIGGAATFIGCNYLARALGGSDTAAQEEKVCHDKALKIQARPH